MYLIVTDYSRVSPRSDSYRPVPGNSRREAKFYVTFFSSARNPAWWLQLQVACTCISGAYTYVRDRHNTENLNWTNGYDGARTFQMLYMNMRHWRRRFRMMLCILPQQGINNWGRSVGKAVWACKNDKVIIAGEKYIQGCMKNKR